MAAAPNGGVVKLAAKIARTGMAPALPDRIGLAAGSARQRDLQSSSSFLIMDSKSALGRAP